MPANTKNKRLHIGGNKAASINPLGLSRQYKAVCVNEGRVLSPKWRNTKAEAIADAQSHVNLGHYIDFEVKIL